mmetsp:Transcript_103643/g.309584  ORF Transcript_103643/g.309584 Transcript_103643/m.309584 type:complete len:224 (+) Transcript_103643:96-767(+)
MMKAAAERVTAASPGHAALQAGLHLRREVLLRMALGCDDEGPSSGHVIAELVLDLHNLLNYLTLLVRGSVVELPLQTRKHELCKAPLAVPLLRVHPLLPWLRQASSPGVAPEQRGALRLRDGLFDLLQNLRLQVVQGTARLLSRGFFCQLLALLDGRRLDGRRCHHDVLGEGRRAARGGHVVDVTGRSLAILVQLGKTLELHGFKGGKAKLSTARRVTVAGCS